MGFAGYLWICRDHGDVESIPVYRPFFGKTAEPVKNFRIVFQNVLRKMHAPKIPLKNLLSECLSRDRQRDRQTGDLQMCELLSECLRALVLRFFVFPANLNFMGRARASTD